MVQSKKTEGEVSGKMRERSCESLLSRRDFGKLALGAIAAAGQQSLGQLAAAAPASGFTKIQKLNYGIGPCWPRELGDIRCELQVSDKADAVWAHIPWRRRDPMPEKKAVILVDAKTNETVNNLATITINREFGDLVFQPETVPGNYYLYYLPHEAETVPWAYSIAYRSPRVTAEPAWLARHLLVAGSSVEANWRTLPKANVLEIEARSDFDRFDPMEVIATEEEVRNLLAQHSARTYLVFPEERQFPIRMTEDLPLRWIERGPTAEFRAVAQRGEFYVFQLGVYAARVGISNLSVEYGDFESVRGKRIPGSTMQCINSAGYDWAGRPFKKTVSVPQGTVRALWFGIQIPKHAEPGMYSGRLLLRPGGAEQTSIRLNLRVSRQQVEDTGDNDLWRQARLRWLNSTVAVDDEVTSPFTPLKVQGHKVSCLGREVHFAPTGFPASIQSNGHEILAAPVSLIVETSDHRVEWRESATEVTGSGPGSIRRQTRMISRTLELLCSTQMEFDGYIDYCVRLTAHNRIPVKDIRLEIPLRKEIATYMMGLGRKGGYRPNRWDWVWDVNRANNQVWVGDIEAGLQCQLNGLKEEWN
jgi:hypothetical protein